MVEIIDVTLRDGGHAVNFDWPMGFARDYYKTLSSMHQVGTLELGYWGQTSKTANTFYNLDYEKVCDVTEKAGLNNVSIMIDYHYCSHNLNDYPTHNQREISMVRMCARKEDMKEAILFGKELKNYTGLNVSFNIFNASNYSFEELTELSTQIKDWPFDYVYFADTHGDLDLTKDFSRFEHFFNVCHNYGKKTGFHLHDHSGMAMVNYREILRCNIWRYKGPVDSTDTSVRGMGKGSGNLKLEYVLHREIKSDLADLARLILDYNDLLTIQPTPYELITSKYALTDNYAKEAWEKSMDIYKFESLCKLITGLNKDSYCEDALNG